MNLPTMPPVRNVVLLIALSIVCVAVAGCGNKGPLVKPSDIPAPVPAATPAATPTDAEPAAASSATPATTPTPEPAAGTPAAPR